jgi:hypothetical protein
VIWISNGERKRVRCGEDFMKAQSVFAKAVAQGKRAATLHADNVGFPPPAQYADVEKIPIGRSRRTKQVVYELRTIEPHSFLVRMRKLNAKGIWWCPYCCKMRRFKLRKYSKVEGIKFEDPRYCCPLCEISHRDMHVRKYNPLAQELAIRMGGRRRRDKSRRRRTRDDDDE